MNGWQGGDRYDGKELNTVWTYKRQEVMVCHDRPNPEETQRIK